MADGVTSPPNPPADRPLPAGCVLACRACHHRTWTMAESLEQKEKFVRTALEPWAAQVQRIMAVPQDKRWGYRRRAKLVARWSAADGWQFGFENRWREFIAIPECPVHHPSVNAVTRLLGKALPHPDQFPLRYFVQNGGIVMLIVKTHAIPPPDWCDDALRTALEALGVQGMWLHGNPGAGRHLFAKNHWVPVFGERFFQDELGLWHERTAFAQLLPELHAESLRAAAEFLAPSPQTLVLDLYSGNGASLQVWERAGAKALGVEIDAGALAASARNAPGLSVLRGLGAQRLPQMEEWSRQPGERLVYCNPPRLGLEPRVLHWLAESYRPARLAYLSCSPGTLRRDLDFLTNPGKLRVAALIPFDFFPQTHHVETLALLRSES